jgi:hypothetical protein
LATNSLRRPHHFKFELVILATKQDGGIAYMAIYKPIGELEASSNSEFSN